MDPGCSLDAKVLVTSVVALSVAQGSQEAQPGVPAEKTGLEDALAANGSSLQRRAKPKKLPQTSTVEAPSLQHQLFLVPPSVP